MKELNLNLEENNTAALVVFTLAAIGAALIAIKGMKSFSKEVKKFVADVEARVKEAEAKEENTSAKVKTGTLDIDSPECQELLRNYPTDSRSKELVIELLLTHSDDKEGLAKMTEKICNELDTEEIGTLESIVRRIRKELDIKSEYDEEEAFENLFTNLEEALDEVKEKRETYFKSHEVSMKELKDATESLEDLLMDTRENYQKITVIKYCRNHKTDRFVHEAIIRYDSDQAPTLSDINTACNYQSPGYDFIGPSSIEKLEDGTFKAQWITSPTHS